MSKKKRTPPEQPAVPVATPAATPDRRPIWRFILGFVALLLLFYALYVTPLFNDYLLEPYVGLQTQMSAGILRLFGSDTHAAGTDLMGPGVTLTVKKGCDGMEATALYMIGVVLMPFSLRSKALGVATGLGILILLNLLRIIGLYISQLHWPAAFDWLHIHGGFALFTAVSVVMWAAWVNWALRTEQQKQ